MARRDKDEHKVTDDDPICVCGLQKHDHFAGAVPPGATANAVATPSGQACKGFERDHAATDAALGSVL